MTGLAVVRKVVSFIDRARMNLQLSAVSYLGRTVTLPQPFILRHRRHNQSSSLLRRLLLHNGGRGFECNMIHCIDGSLR